MRGRPAWIRLLHRLLLSCFHAALVIGKSNHAFYLKNGFPPDRLFTAPYFIDNERFRRQAEHARSHRVALRAGWGIPDHATTFLYVGKLEPKKRLLDLLKAINIVRGQCPHVCLLVVGTGELMEEARKIVQQLSLPVVFAGFLNQTEITRAYVAADCLVLPSDYGETWGLVVNEAMACGLPALVSDRVGCRPDLIREGETGASFSFGNVQALGDKLVELASDRERLRRMGKAARIHIDNYSVTHAVEGTLKAIQAVVRQ